ncbi:MAG: hypothetical protein KGL39_20125 [Patescibacteria group bacterium]|nr:hypothetical protein [Patescibacteria group bacterium]
MDKPHKGKIKNWTKLPTGMGPLGFYIWGEFVDHPDFGNKVTNTSYVVKHDEQTGDIETRNSRYTLIGPPQSTS